MAGVKRREVLARGWAEMLTLEPIQASTYSRFSVSKGPPRVSAIYLLALAYYFSARDFRVSALTNETSLSFDWFVLRWH